ncbi:MAG: hypothetical protein HUJ76_04815 [Parasporobacterium sp.]|nr:hypothetical protein [Parasporobacterium sp.]
MFNKVAAFIGFICALIITFIFMEKPLKEREIEGIKSIIIRLVAGCIAGLLASFAILL